MYIGQYTDFVQTDSTDYKKYSWTKIKGETGPQGQTGATGPQGPQGPAGKGIKSTAITYQASTSGTTAPTGNWTTTIPTVSQGQYLWSRTVITYTDNSTSTTYSVAYIPKNGQNGATGPQGPQGKPGTTGATGQGVSSITQQYYLSTSKTTQTGGSWVTSMPTWSVGKYLWTRYLIIYKNPTSTAYTNPICDSSWEVVNDVQNNIEALKTQYKSDLKVEQDRITANISATNALQQTTSKLEQTAESLSFSLSETKKEVSDAAKTATNFLGFDSTGLVVGDRTKSKLGKNVLIDSDSVDIRNGNTILASFSESRIDLGKNNANAIIGLCDNKGTIEVVDYTEYQALELRSEFTEIVGEQQVRICSPSSAGACIYVEDYNILLLNRPGFDDGTGKTFESSIGLTDNGIYISMNDDKSVSQLSIKSTIIEANKQIKAPDLYGTNKVLANNGFQTGGCVDTFKNNILWSGSAMWPNASQTANFSQTVSKQPHGIVLVFRGYNSGVQNGDWHSFFVSKHEVAKHGGQGHCFFLSHTPSVMFATKYIYISDNRLTGHDNNSKSETTSEGITYRNNRYVLQYVLGV